MNVSVQTLHTRVGTVVHTPCFQQSRCPQCDDPCLLPVGVDIPFAIQHSLVIIKHDECIGITNFTLFE
jgi:hypothetical protein